MVIRGEGRVRMDAPAGVGLERKSPVPPMGEVAV